MNFLFENPLRIAIVGGLLATFALVVFLSRRDLGSLLALAGVTLMTLALIAVERFVTTDREQVQAALTNVLAAVEANNQSAVLDAVDPAAANVRADAKSLMPLVGVEKARATGTVEFSIDPAKQPPTASTRFRGFLDGVEKQGGERVGFFDDLDIQWIKRNDRWLVTGYTAFFKGQPIDAVTSAHGNRPVPAK